MRLTRSESQSEVYRNPYHLVAEPHSVRHYRTPQTLYIDEVPILGSIRPSYDDGNEVWLYAFRTGQGQNRAFEPKTLHDARNIAVWFVECERQFRPMRYNRKFAVYSDVEAICRTIPRTPTLQDARLQQRSPTVCTQSGEE